MQHYIMKEKIRVHIYSMFYLFGHIAFLRTELLQEDHISYRCLFNMNSVQIIFFFGGGGGGERL